MNNLCDNYRRVKTGYFFYLLLCVLGGIFLMKKLIVKFPWFILSYGRGRSVVLNPKLSTLFGVNIICYKFKAGTSFQSKTIACMFQSVDECANNFLFLCVIKKQ